MTVLWIAAIPVPLGLLSPFAAMDRVGEPPGWASLALVLGPLVVASVFGLHVLGKYRAEFRW